MSDRSRSQFHFGRRFRRTPTVQWSMGATLVVLSLVAMACGSDESGADTTAASPTAADTAASPTTGAEGGTSAGTAGGTTPAPASGEALRIGFINQEAGSVGVYPETVAAAEAAVEYINTELGGLDGHPLELVKCVTDGTVPATQRCAEQMVNEGVVFAQAGLDNNLQALHPILEAAGIPLLGGIPITPGDFNATNARFFIAGGAVAYPGLATYILEFMPDVKTVGILANDSPGAAAALPLVTKPLQAAGIEVTDVKVPATQSDWLAPFASVRDFDAAAVLVAPPNCISLAGARQSQQSDLPMVSVSSCYSQSIIDEVGEDGLNGWVVNQYFDDPRGDTPDAQTYQQAMETYAGPDANLSGFAPVSFTNVMTMYTNVLEPLGFEGATVEAIMEKVDDPAGGKVFMGPEYQCSQPDAPFAAICNYQLQWFQIEGGKLTNPTGFVDIIPTIKVATA
jgi:branched-chain amino acid transport system substrate-binding protein